MRSCNIHLTFWDRRFRGRDKECKQVLKWLFHEILLERATIEIPEIAHYTANFIQALGFKREGRIRKNWSYKGKLVDTFIFGLLKDEILSPQITN
jgi:RimJ/RimL family protein N-acetyltransferase